MLLRVMVKLNQSLEKDLNQSLAVPVGTLTDTGVRGSKCAKQMCPVGPGTQQTCKRDYAVEPAENTTCPKCDHCVHLIKCALQDV